MNPTKTPITNEIVARYWSGNLLNGQMVDSMRYLELALQESEQTIKRLKALEMERIKRENDVCWE